MALLSPHLCAKISPDPVFASLYTAAQEDCSPVFRERCLRRLEEKGLRGSHALEMNLFLNLIIAAMEIHNAVNGQLVFHFYLHCELRDKNTTVQDIQCKSMT